MFRLNTDEPERHSEVEHRHMTYWLKAALFAITIGFAKAHHFIQLIILAGLGLAGLWMIHILAQDFTNVQSSGGDTKIFKRAIQDGTSAQINWEIVLSRDPASCARSFLCQLAAADETSLTKEEKVMVEVTRTAAEQATWAGKQLQEALNNGEKVDRPSQCMKIYKYCPYTSQMMMALLRVFGR
ncbi:hypothetical protein NQ317_007401 [Molorchus minor]|uniref:Uncharacterized protein n=1 Tax=Molorchus minor TaxID=1323400 RepID=A0ABQ9JWZ7_9CUCU|nr:hypothetical protein NQ317_007401 [Molorchus minor]